MTRCHAPIDVRRVGLDRRKLCDPRVVGRKVAYRIGCGGIAGERVSARLCNLPTFLRALVPIKIRGDRRAESRQCCSDRIG